MRRVEKILAHINGGDDETSLWASLMDEKVIPLPVKPHVRSEKAAKDEHASMGGGCSCTRGKWTPGCKCARCEEHYNEKEPLDCILRPLQEEIISTKGLEAMHTSGDSSFSDEKGVTSVQLGDCFYLKKGNNIGSMDPGKHWRVGGIPTFCRLPQLYQIKHADVAIVGCPFDSGCSFRTGARFGPEAIRENSRLVRPYVMKTGSQPLLDQQVADAGDIHITPFNIPDAMRQIHEGLTKIQGKADTFVIIGGDHTVAYPAVKAAYEKWGPIALIHFDAHLDTFPPQFGQDIWHGSPFRQCWKENLFAKDASTHVGIRATTWSRNDVEESTDMGIQTIYTEDVHEKGVDACVDMVRQRAGNHPTYVSIDIDVLDPAIAPGTGTPEFGGMLAHQLLQFVRKLDGLNVISGDIVEVLPAYDHAGMTSLAASSLAVEILTLIHRSPKKKTR